MNFNTLLLSLGLSICSTAVFSQDIISKKDGSDIQAKVTDIEESVIKYKKFDNQGGPSYSISKKDVERIKFENGSIENFGGEETSNSEPASEEPKTTVSSGGTFSLENENTVKQIEAIAKYAGERVLAKCTGKPDNSTTEVYFDGVFQDEFSKEIVIPIRIKWQPKNISGDNKWVRGVVRVSQEGKKSWTYQNDSGGWFGRCAKGLKEL